MLLNKKLSGIVGAFALILFSSYVLAHEAQEIVEGCIQKVSVDLPGITSKSQKRSFLGADGKLHDEYNYALLLPKSTIQEKEKIFDGVCLCLEQRGYTLRGNRNKRYTNRFAKDFADKTYSVLDVMEQWPPNKDGTSGNLLISVNVYNP